MQLNIARKIVRSTIARGRAGKALVGPEILSRALDGWFDNKNWEATYPDVIKAGRKPDLNPGQESIFDNDYETQAVNYCRLYGEEYDPDAFMAFVESGIGGDKYNAISEIIEETSQSLYEAWDYCYGGDGLGDKLFGDYHRDSGIKRGQFVAPRSVSFRSIGRIGRRR